MEVCGVVDFSRKLGARKFFAKLGCGVNLMG
jgi:hypothetical protein